MDIMQIRRILMTIGGNNSLWNQIVLTATETLSTNTDISTWIENNVPSYTLCMVAINDMDIPSMANNHFVFMLGGDVEGTRSFYAYTRKRTSGQSYLYQARSFATTEDCIINQGESVTVFYQ